MKILHLKKYFYSKFQIKISRWLAIKIAFKNVYYQAAWTSYNVNSN